MANFRIDPISYLTRGRWSLERAAENRRSASLAGRLLTAAWNDAQQGIKLAPENPQLAILAAETAIAQGTPEQAKELVSQALAANPRLPELYVADRTD